MRVKHACKYMLVKTYISDFKDVGVVWTTAVWATNTDGRNSKRLEIRPDGYLALTNDDAETVWMLNWPRKDIWGCYLEMTGSGLKLYGKKINSVVVTYEELWSRPAK
jgi:hypothetical protein